jgi:hypothetical protein
VDLAHDYHAEQYRDYLTQRIRDEVAQARRGRLGEARPPGYDWWLAAALVLGILAALAVGL